MAGVKNNNNSEIIVCTDDTMPNLPIALNTDLMSKHFQNLFDREYSGEEMMVENLQITRVYHKPEKRCGITYHLTGKRGAEETFDQWFYAVMIRKSLSKFMEKSDVPETWPGCGFWRPMLAWDDLNIVLYTFPYDPRMPYLGELMSKDFIRQTVDNHLPEINPDADNEWQCGAIDIQKFKYRPKKNCVLRYQIEINDKNGKTENLSLFSKTYNSPHSQYVYRVLKSLYNATSANDGILSVPEPLLHLDNANSYWMKEWQGEKLRMAGERMGWEKMLNTDLLARIAHMLGELQTSKLENLHDKPDTEIDAIIKRSCEEINDIIGFQPALKPALSRIPALLTTAGKSLDTAYRRSTIHGTFKMAQILYREDALAVIDFDAISEGDPLYDVAEFLASLINLRITDNFPAAIMQEKIEEFLREYQAVVPWECDRRCISFYLITFLLGKIHSTLKRLNTKRTINIDNACEVINEWMAVLEAPEVV